MIKIREKLNLVAKRRAVIYWWLLTQVSRVCAVIALVLFGLPALVFDLIMDWYDACRNRLRNLKWQAFLDSFEYKNKSKDKE